MTDNIYSFSSDKYFLVLIGKNYYDSNVYELKIYEISKFVILTNESELYKKSDVITTKKKLNEINPPPKFLKLSNVIIKFF